MARIDYPLTFKPIFKERVWGGRNLEQLYHKPLPQGAPIGESWEISDRPGDVSVIANGPLAGRDLHWLMTHHREELLGAVRPEQGRFPWLVKILDAKDKLSLQVHPPARKAAELGGDPKTEMWYIAGAAPDAALYVGLRHGVTRAEFEEKIRTGAVAECFHRVPVKRGDAMFLPSGRVHAIGAGLVIFEIQQNSDTTYRVFDWNRKGLDGKARELHVAESLASIDFEDFEPELVTGAMVEVGMKVRTLVRHGLFTVNSYAVDLDELSHLTLSQPPQLRVVGVLTGRLTIYAAGGDLGLQAGEFGLIPASAERVRIEPEPGTEFLMVGPGDESGDGVGPGGAKHE